MPQRILPARPRSEAGAIFTDTWRSTHDWQCGSTIELRREQRTTARVGGSGSEHQAGANERRKPWARRSRRTNVSMVEGMGEVAPTMYLGMDGTGVPMRKEEVADRAGKQADGSAKTREAKLVTVWTAESRDEEGKPTRDPGSLTYSAAIESAATRDTSPNLSDFAARVQREADRRRFHRSATLSGLRRWFELDLEHGDGTVPQAEPDPGSLSCQRLSAVGWERPSYGEIAEAEPWIQARYQRTRRRSLERLGA